MIGLILFTGAFLVSAVFVVYYAYVCTKSVPTDSLVIKQRCMSELHQVFEPKHPDTGETLELYCNICNVYVNERTKHCGQCNRCCADFDHHCKWLNNCIGSKNYWDFRKLINAFMVYTVLSVLSFIMLFFTDEFLDQMREKSNWLYITLFTQAVMNFLVILFDL